MWCHLCKMKFTDQEVFKIHIMKNHRPVSEFYEDDSDSEHSEQNENVETFDDIDESEIDENEEDMMLDYEIDEENENFSSGESYDEPDFSSEMHADTSTMNVGRKTAKYVYCTQDFDSESKTDLKLQDSKSDQKIISPESVGNNRQLYILNPSTNQETFNSPFLENQQTQQPMFMFNSCSIPDQLPLPNIRGGFDFNSRNILIWLLKLKEMCRTLKFPLQPRLFTKIKIVHKEIFDCYNTASSNEVTTSVMKVYEELDNMIHKHITSINEQL